jgi:Bifunctional DNA primase/polymerase, N-terminal/Family of unknown function (DUF5906)
MSASKLTFAEKAKFGIERGFFVFPLAPNSKVPPKGKHGYQDATQDASKIDAWNLENPDYNIGYSTEKFLPPGQKEVCSLIVVDIDVSKGKRGRETAQELKREGFGLSPTLSQTTASGGFHFIYRHRTGVPSGVSKLGRNIDVCSHGRYIVGAFSTIRGNPYSLQDGSVCEAPEWVVKRCGEVTEKRKVPAEEKRAIAFLKKAEPAIEFQGGNSKSVNLAMQLRDMGIAETKALELMLEHWNERCDPPWSLSELSTIVKNGYQYAKESFGNKAPEIQFDVIGPEAKDLDPIQKLNTDFAFVISGSSHHIIWETLDSEGKPFIQHLKEEAFHKLHASKSMAFGDKPRPVTKVWMNDPARRTYRGFCFKPEKTVPAGWYNLWRGFAVKPSIDKGENHESVRAFLEHTEKNVCQGDKELNRWLLGYFAHLVQRPWEKPLTGLVFKGEKGVGKSALVDRVGYLLGSHYSVAADSRYLTGNFNAHLENSLFMVLEEAFWSGDPKANGILKHLVTGRTHKIERKNHEAYDIENLTRVCIIGNEGWLVAASQDERRYAVFNVGEGRKQDLDFFETMRVGMENGGYSYLLRFLLDFDLTGIRINRAPKSEGLLQQKVASLPPFEEWWFKCLKDESIVEDYGLGWPRHISKRSFREASNEYFKSRNIRSRYPTPEQIGHYIHVVCPSLDRHLRVYGEDGIRDRAFGIPPLEVCRAEWEAYIGHKVDWEA